MATLADALRGYQPSTESPISDVVTNYASNVLPQAKANLLRQAGNVQNAIEVTPDLHLQVKDPQAFNKFMNEVPNLANMVTYHGTPHEIKGAFDISKVGTGEGAQAYGHGMYFAESPQVAKTYMNTGTPVNDRAKLVLELNNNDIDAAIAQAQRGIDDAKLVSSQNRKLAEKNAQALVDELSYIKNPTQPTLIDKLLGKSKGNLYKVDIPDEHIPNMLDWDKPLNQQSVEVLKAIKIPQKAADRYNEISNRLDELQWTKGGLDSPEWNKLFEEAKDIKAKYGLHRSGEELYREAYKVAEKAGAENPSQVAAESLKAQGISGIRYLDEGSRSKGAGTSNFVVFDPSTVQILEKNGKPTRKDIIEQQVNKVLE